ncbi:3-hydroxybenzoate 6-hydroxylase 1 [Colletotrichum gloeosporioides]|uniref:3-hydroxybenzoate 6-hydroxylase 1 n=1 Tax=Colletotrichum gloeosporioides TaxID=474922 RepID=A0A8H4CBU9_COLGL|nr:3-hydroxybenzoate 6-hydroxylase 1 [Colletotrichum gloeosporioides]KAF3801055.1 3-hydroxybenzoate 6-hydroxylase 1 [Colletotrichum gloeosporioides]
MKIIIVGAGLGGLCAAFGFARKGHHVRVFEQRPDLSPAGGALNIRPGASKILHSWGLAEDLRSVSADTPANVFRNLATGEVATRAIATDISEYPDWGTSRSVLIEIFYQKAKDAGAVIEFNAPVMKVEDGTQAAYVTLGNGKRLEADLVLAADGIRSVIRDQILRETGQPIDPIITDVTLYGVSLTKEEMQNHPGLAPLIDQSYLNIYMSDGGLVHVTSRYNITSGSYAALFGVKGSTDQRGLWDEKGDIEYVRDMFKGACPEIRTALDVAKSCDRWRLAELPDLPRWTSIKGRVLLLGDSAHAMQPSAAQGFSLIVEDIGVLEYLISQASDPSANVKTITSFWQEIRKARCERIKAWASHNTNLFTSRSKKLNPRSGKWQVKSLKDTKPDMNAEFSSGPFLKWAQGTDAIAEAEKYLRAGRSHL